MAWDTGYQPNDSNNGRYYASILNGSAFNDLAWNDQLGLIRWMSFNQTGLNSNLFLVGSNVEAARILANDNNTKIQNLETTLASIQLKITNIQNSLGVQEPPPLSGSLSGITFDLDFIWVCVGAIAIQLAGTWAFRRAKSVLSFKG